MAGRIHQSVDYPHVLQVMETKLVREGFTRDTPERRRLVQLMAGPKPVINQNEMEDVACITH